MALTVSVLVAIAAACSGKVRSEPPSGGGGSNAGGAGFGGSFGGAGSGGFVPGGGGAGFGGVGATGGSPTWDRVGRACANDAECGSVVDSFCVLPGPTEVFDGGWPAKGYCTADCSADPTICPELNATCLTFSSGKSFCVETCKPGPPGLTQFDPFKCHGRQEVACTPVMDASGAFTSGICLPQCNHDQACPAGYSCSAKTGLCTDNAASGLAIGSPCEVWIDAGPNSCAGICLELESTLPGLPVPACTQSCTLGAIGTCGWQGPGTGPAAATCLYAAPGLEALGGPGVGDLGYCGKLCDCDDECLAQYECLPWPDPDAQALKDFFGREGYCGVNQVGGDAAVMPCGG